MTDKRERGVRRSPRTELSESIRDAVVEAAAELLVVHGLDGMTTNRIAKRAGVSVGSVYRYFEDKQAIVAEIGRRQRLRNAEALAELIAGGGDLDVLLRNVLERFALVGLEQEFQLRRVLTREIPPSWLQPIASQAWGMAQRTVANALHDRLPALSPDEAERRAFVAVHAAEGVLRDAALQDDVDDRSALIEELVRLLLPYLQRPAG